MAEKGAKGAAPAKDAAPEALGGLTVTLPYGVSARDLLRDGISITLIREPPPAPPPAAAPVAAAPPVGKGAPPATPAKPTAQVTRMSSTLNGGLVGAGSAVDIAAEPPPPVRSLCTPRAPLLLLWGELIGLISRKRHRVSTADQLLSTSAQSPSLPRSIAVLRPHGRRQS